MTEPKPGPTPEQLERQRIETAKRVELMKELKRVVDQAKIRLRAPRLEAVLGDGIIIADCYGIRDHFFKLGHIYASFDNDEVQEAIDFVTQMR